MRNTELTHQILLHLRKGMKQRAIAEELHCHYNTVYRHVRWLRLHQLYGDEETLNKIDNRLHMEINTMPVPSLLSWRGQLVPKRIESKSEVTVTKEVSAIDVRKFSLEERDEITRVIRHLAATRTVGEE